MISVYWVGASSTRVPTVTGKREHSCVGPRVRVRVRVREEGGEGEGGRRG